jgi:hypothetical protein
MDIESELLNNCSRRLSDRIAFWIGTDTKRFAVLMNVFLHGEPPAARHSAMAVGICAERHPALVKPYIGRMLFRIEEPGVHVALRRTVVRMLQDVDIPPELLGKVATLCFRYLSAGESPVAVKVFAMSVIARIAKKEPDLGRELRLLIEQGLPYGTNGYRSRARRVLKDMAALY